MHILLIHQYFQEKDDPGGLRWNAMAASWAAKGHTITVIAGMTHYTKGIRNPKYDNKYVYVDDFAKNICVIRTHVSDSYNNNFKGRFRAYFSFVISGIYGGLFKARDKYDMILVSSPPLSVGLIALTLSFLKRIPFVFEIRDLWPESAIDTGILKNKFMIWMSFLLEKRAYRKSKLINVLTPAMRETLVTKKNIPADKIIYIPNAADFDLTDHLLQAFDRAAFRVQLGIENKLALCYVGAHGIANHLLQLIEAAILLKNEPVVFLLIGDGMQKNMLMEKTEALELKNILFFDSVSKEEALKYIIASDIGLSVLKKVDTFKTVYSNKTFDYMACKKPVIMAIDGISRQLIEEAGAGMYAEPENAVDIAAAVRFYLQQPDQISLQGNKGYQFAKSHFDRENLATQYIQALEQLHTKLTGETVGNPLSPAPDDVP